MIICVQIYGETIYQPLVFDPNLDAWVPLSEKTYATPMEAAHACHEALSKAWKAVMLSARKLRALTEHPRFQELEADGISAELISDEARHLTVLIDRHWTDFVHLLDGPNESDLVLASREIGQGANDSNQPSDAMKQTGLRLIGSLNALRSTTHHLGNNLQTLIEQMREEEPARGNGHAPTNGHARDDEQDQEPSDEGDN